MSRSKIKDLRPAMQDLIRIKSVFDIYKASRILVGMVANTWKLSSACDGCFRQCMPGLAKVHVGKETFVLPGFLLQDIEPMVVRTPGAAGGWSSQITDPTVAEVRVRHPTPYFRHVIVLLKLRWMLRLHSACCELDYKMCSCAALIKGLQYVALQQFAEAEADSGFDKKVSQHVGCHLNVECVLDDIFDQLQRALGGGWHAFREFVSTCDPMRAVHHSPMDLGTAPIIPNDSLLTIIDTVFVACFLRERYGRPESDLKGLYKDFEMLGLPLPELPALRRAQHLRMWAKAKTKPTRQDRDRASKKDIDKLAQLDAVLMCAAVELQLPEVLATQEEIADMNSTTLLQRDRKKGIHGDVAPEVVDFGSTGQTDMGGPPAARTIFAEKPYVTPHIFNAVTHCVHHHLTFPSGIRERLFALLLEEYSLTTEQSERLAIAVTQNIDGKRLPDSTLIQMAENEKHRLHDYEVVTYKDCAHLLVSPLVSSLGEKSKPAKYTWQAPTPCKDPDGWTKDLARSLPNLRGFTIKGNGRPDFKVALSTGPLTMDPDLNKLHTTGFFIKMPALGPL
jgi:hypothetical protein